jgi:hypothetical protein
MIDFLSRFLAKCRGWIIVGVILAGLGGLFCLTVDQIVKRFIPSIVSLTADRIRAKITFQKVHYLFPHRVTLKDVKVFSLETSSRFMLDVPELDLDFTIPIFYKHEKIHVSQVTFNQTSVHVPAIRNYLEREGPLLWAVLRSLPASNMKILLPGTQVYLFKDSKIAAPLALNIDFNLNDGQFSGKIKDRVSILQYWGAWKNNRIDWKGFMFYEGPLTKVPLYVLDIDGQAIVKSKDLWLKKFSFSVNNDRFLVTGHFLLDQPMKFETKVSYRRELNHIRAQDPLIAMDTTIRGETNYQGVLMDGQMDFDLFSNERIHMPLQKVSVVFNHLQTAVINDSLLQLKAKEVLSSFLTYRSEYKFSLENFLASIQRGQKAQFIAALSTNLYGGRYQGQMTIDTSPSPWQIQVRGKVEEVDVSRLSDLIKYFNKGKGYLSGSFDVQAPTNMSLQAVVSMREGEFTDFSFFPVAVSKIFQMPSLDHLSEADVSLRLKLNRQEAAIDNFKLRSNNINLHGSFRMDANNLVNSQMSILFPKDVLGESPIGQRVMRLVPQAWQMPFEFHLSGDISKMNFQWDDSPLKRKIEQRLPHFVERTIEQRVDEKASI